MSSGKKTRMKIFPPIKKQKACAALMTRAAWLDGTLDKVEEKALRDLMMKRSEFPGEADEILKAAADDLDTSNDLYRYEDLRDNFDADERLKLIEMIWEVVYADGVLHDFEATLARRLAGFFMWTIVIAVSKKRAMHKLGLRV